MADDPVVPTPDKSQGAVVQPPTPGPGPDSEPPPNGNVDDPAVAACGPAAAIPAVDGAILVGCTTTKPVIDGSFSEWENVPATSIDAVVFPQDGSNPNGVHGEARLLWDREALYVQFSVVDPARRDVDEGQPDQYWRGDAVSFEFGPDARALAAGTRVRDDVDRHVIIGISGDRALADINPASRGDFPSGSAAPEIDAALIATADGYHVEARVPWSSLAVEQPARGAVFAGNLNISDAQIARKWDLGTMVSSNPQRTIQRQPLVWQPIVLGDPS
jgi:hypothetical protein